MTTQAIYPLTAPGMPLPGADFIDEANLRAEGTEPDTLVIGKKTNQKVIPGPVLEELTYEALYGGGNLSIGVSFKDKQKTRMPIIAGHRWRANPHGVTAGPEPCEVMVVGKMLGENELRYRRCLVGPTGDLFLETLRKFGAAREAGDWYITNVLKTANPDPGGNWHDSYSKGFLYLLHQELRLVRPKYVLCLGADSLKALFGKNMTQAKAEGRVLELSFPVNRTDDEEPENHTALVMGCLHPAAVLRNPERLGQMELSISRFVQLTRGTRWDLGETDLDHRLIDNEDDLRALVEEIRAGGTNQLIAVDAEWHGEHAQNVGAYLRTIQVSWKHKTAACIILSGVGGVPAFKRRAGNELTTVGGFEVAIELIRELLRDQRPCGHYFAADLEWLTYYGLEELVSAFAPPDDWTKCRDEGGLDTALMAHAVDETADFSLTAQILQRTSAPRYDVALAKWKENYCKQNGIKPKDLDGYGMCPEEILYPYANYDADTTRRLAVALMPELDSDRFGNNCWKAFWISQRAVAGVLEMKRTGLVLDRDAVDKMTGVYMERKGWLASQIRKWARWPDLNLESVYQTRELLFGSCYNGKRDAEGKIVRLRPKGARSLLAVPMITTEKRPRQWTDLRIEERKMFAPSTNRLALGMMAFYGSRLPVRRKAGIVRRDRQKIVQLVRDYRFIGQILKSTLRKPAEDENGVLLTDATGHWLYKAGIAGSLCSDGRVRTTMYTTKETGRWSSARPPLHNLSRRREPEYKRILGDNYPGPLRSILCAPEGHVLVEADYIGAELFVAAILSGDETMLDHVQRNQLPEDHPDFYDIHSNMCKFAFRLDCEPTKAGLASIGKKQTRVAAKSALFGLMYGRGPRAIALSAKEEGIEVSVDEAQAIIDAIFAMYPGLRPFFDECKLRAASRSRTRAPRWMQNPYGRYRRFPETTDDKVKGDLERQGLNFLMQSTVADVVSCAVAELQAYPRNDIDYKLCLQIHDAIMCIVRNEHVARFIDEVLPACMVQAVPIYPTFPDGRPQGTGPYYLGIDTTVASHWGVTPLPDELEKRGISYKYAGWKPANDGLVHEEAYPKKIWKDGRLRSR